MSPAEGGEALVLSAASGTTDDDSDGLDGLRALCVAHWTRHPDDGAPVTLVAGDDRAAGVLNAWGLGGSPS